MASIEKRGRVYYLRWADEAGAHTKSLKTGDRRTAERVLAKVEIHVAKKEWDLLPQEKEDRLVYDFLNLQIRNIHAFKNPSTARTEAKRLEQLRDFLLRSKIATLKDVRLENVEQFMYERAKTCATKTLNEQLRVIKRTFQDAVENGLILHNPARKINRYRREDRNTKKPVYWEIDEVDAIARGATTGCDRDTFLLFCNMGLRLNEMMHLEWTDVRFEQRTLSIQSKPHLNWWTKSRQDRNIPINEVALEALSRMQKNQTDDFVVHDPAIRRNGLYWHRLHRMKMAAGISKGSTHSCRHTFASHLVMAGVDLATVSTLLGHANIRSTMIYAHLAPSHLQTAVAKIRLGASKESVPSNVIPFRRTA